MALTIDKKDKRKITTWVPYKHQREICISLDRTGIQPTFKGRWSTSTWLWGYEAMSLAPKSGIPKPRQVAVDPTWDEVFEILESQLLEQPVPWNQGGNVKIDETFVFSAFMFVVVLFLLQCWWGILWVYYTFHIWFMLYMYIIFNDLMTCILYTWGWLMPRVGRRFAVPLGCFHGVVVCSSIPRMGCTSCCQNYEIMCKSYNQWEFQDPKLEVPTIYKAYFSGLNFSEYPHKIWPKIWY